MSAASPALRLPHALLLAAAFLLSGLPVSPALAAGSWVGLPAPAFNLPDQDGQRRQLQDFHGQWLLLYFYPKDGTPGCTREAQQFRQLWPALQQAGIAVVGVSLDSVASHKAFAQRLQLPFPLLADEQRELTRAMGVLRGFGPLRYASRQSFLIDPQGNIVYHYDEVDSARHAAQVLADVARLSARP